MLILIGRSYKFYDYQKLIYILLQISKLQDSQPYNVWFTSQRSSFFQGRSFVFNVALALLKVSRKDLLALDFEGILKYFRVQLPKRFRTEEATSELMQVRSGRYMNYLSLQLKKIRLQPVNQSVF